MLRAFVERVVKLLYITSTSHFSNTLTENLHTVTVGTYQPLNNCRYYSHLSNLTGDVRPGSPCDHIPIVVALFLVANLDQFDISYLQRVFTVGNAE